MKALKAIFFVAIPLSFLSLASCSTSVHHRDDDMYFREHYSDHHAERQVHDVYHANS